MPCCAQPPAGRGEGREAGREKGPACCAALCAQAFVEAAEAYAQRYLQKGIPSLFRDLRPLYQASRPCSSSGATALLACGLACFLLASCMPELAWAAPAWRAALRPRHRPASGPLAVESTENYMLVLPGMNSCLCRPLAPSLPVLCSRQDSAKRDALGQLFARLEASYAAEAAAAGSSSAAAAAAAGDGSSEQQQQQQEQVSGLLICRLCWWEESGLPGVPCGCRAGSVPAP